MPAAAIPLLLTRPQGSNTRFKAALSGRVRDAVRTIDCPLIGIVGLATSPPQATTDAIFTSGNGVAHAPPGEGRNAFCVGAATCEAAKRAGWAARALGQDADALVAALLAERPDGPLTHFCGVHTRGQVAERLSAAGMVVQPVTVYDQREQPLTDAARAALDGADPVIVPLFSPRTARIFTGQAEARAPLWIVAMSADVAREVVALKPEKLRISHAPTLTDMAKALEKLV